MGNGGLPMRSWQMQLRTPALLALPLIVLGLAGCEKKPPEPQPVETPAAVPPPPVAPPSTLAPAPSPSSRPSEQAKPDSTALNGRRDPDRLLRSYAAALHAKDWASASRAWASNSGVTAETLKAAYDRRDRPTLEVGKGQVEGAAGSLYYEAPVVLRFGSDTPERGTLTLRRVNDVPGASPEQLRWHIERATIGVGQ